MKLFIVRTPEDVFPAIKKLRAGGSVTVVPSMRAIFEHEARAAGLTLAVEDGNFWYKFRAMEDK